MYECVMCVFIFFFFISYTMPRRVGVHRPRPTTAHVPYQEFQLSPNHVCPTPELLEQLRKLLHEPSTSHSQAVLAHWTDHLGVWLDEREAKEI